MRKFLIALIVVLCCIWAIKLSKLRGNNAEPAMEPVPPAAQATAEQPQSSTETVAATPAQPPAAQKPAAPPVQEKAQPAAPAAKPKSEAPKAQAPAQDKFAVLDEILASGNDNDPRLDTAFNNLSQGDRRRLEAKCSALPHEKLNQRGTIVYLLGRDPQSASDWNFLSAVAAEKPCLSMSDCRTDGGPLDTHREIGIELSLTYPAMMALKQAEHAVRRGNQAGRAVIEAAKTSSSKLVVQEAERFEQMGR